MDDKKRGILKNTDLFENYCNDELSLIAENSEFLEVAKGNVLFSPGDSGQCLFVIESGEIIIRKQGLNDQNIDIARFLKGNSFGELDLLTKAPRNAYAVALENTRLLKFPDSGTSFEDILESFPVVSARILHKFLVEIAGRIRNANTLIKENSPLVQELKKQVYLDKLTGLYNRTFLEEKIDGLLSLRPQALSVLMIKPDNFKEINDTYGHESGDAALQFLSEELKKRVGDDQRVIRFMGNEMAVLFPECGRDDAKKKAEGLRDFLKNLNWDFVTGGKSFILTASIGIAVYPEHGIAREVLIQKAHELPLIGRGRGGDIILFPEDKLGG